VIPLSEAARKGESLLAPSHRPLRSIPDEVAQQRQRIGELEQEMAVKSAFALATGELAALGGTAWGGDQKKLASARTLMYRLQTEPHRRWANGFSCLCFVLIGAPMAIRRQKSDFWAIFAVCFVPILLLYYPLLFAGVDRAKAGAWPPFSVWLANLALLLWGFWLLARVRRY
jgi:lipopolysaccharide export system permease protein